MSELKKKKKGGTYATTKALFYKKSDLRNIAGRNAYLHVESQFHRFWETALFSGDMQS